MVTAGQARAPSADCIAASRRRAGVDIVARASKLGVLLLTVGQIRRDGWIPHVWYADCP